MPAWQPVLIESFYIHRNRNPLYSRFQPKLYPERRFGIFHALNNCTAKTIKFSLTTIILWSDPEVQHRMVTEFYGAKEARMTQCVVIAQQIGLKPC
jgi:hypothetical protein